MAAGVYLVIKALLKHWSGLGSPQREGHWWCLTTLGVCGHRTILSSPPRFCLIPSSPPSLLLLTRLILLLANSAAVSFISLSPARQPLDLEGDGGSGRSVGVQSSLEREGKQQRVERKAWARGAEVQWEGSDGAKTRERGEWRRWREGMWTSYAGSCQVGRGTWAAYWAGIDHFLLPIPFSPPSTAISCYFAFSFEWCGVASHHATAT